MVGGNGVTITVVSFYPEIETEYGDNSWVYLLAKYLVDKGVNLDEEVFIYAE